MQRLPRLALAGALAAALLAGSAATDALGQVPANRSDAMRAHGAALRTMTPMMRGQAPYDAEAVRRAAQSLAAISGDPLVGLFPPGSAEGTRARAEIWTRPDEFRRYAANMGVLAAALAENPGTGPGQPQQGLPSATAAPLQPAAVAGASPITLFGMIGETCAACHTSFRAER